MTRHRNNLVDVGAFCCYDYTTQNEPPTVSARRVSARSGSLQASGILHYSEEKIHRLREEEEGHREDLLIRLSKAG